MTAVISMTRVRNAILAGAVQQPDPGRILTAANARLAAANVTEFAGTALCAIVDADGTIDYASAGHPPALLYHHIGGEQWLPSRGLPLGLGVEPYETARATALAGSIAVFYTDGLTECTRDIVEGEARLVAAIREAMAQSPENLAFFVKQRTVADSDYLDDIAIVTVAFTASAAAGARERPFTRIVL